uniref:ATPase subunit 8 n=1 Tax=Cocconeiopsis kantsiensis TaxID=3082010 RepID=UPI003003A671
MAQFDPLIIFSLIVSLLLVLFLYYTLSIKVLIPDFFSVKKFREKKYNSPVFYKNFSSNKNVKAIYSYKSTFF